MLQKQQPTEHDFGRLIFKLQCGEIFIPMEVENSKKIAFQILLFKSSNHLCQFYDYFKQRGFSNHLEGMFDAVVPFNRIHFTYLHLAIRSFETQSNDSSLEDARQYLIKNKDKINIWDVLAV